LRVRTEIRSGDVCNRNISNINNYMWYPHEGAGRGKFCSGSESLEFCPSSGILNNWKTAFRRLDVFPSSDEGMESPALRGP
jgi:hypothetical protein